MMTGIKIVCVGKVKEAYFKEGIDYYIKKIRRKYPIEIMECPDEATPDQISDALSCQIRETEGKRILKRIKDEDYVIALCIDGSRYSTSQWKKRILTQISQKKGNIVFVVGGSLGLSDSVIQRADETLSFSALTFPHQMMRLILCQQLCQQLTGSW